MTQKKPQTPTSIHSSLNAAQKKFTKVHKDANNPHFKSKYATLAAVCDAVFPALLDEGFAIMQAPCDDGKAVETRLVLGGESISCRMPIVGNPQTPQQYGSALTYARRYGLMTLLGIAPEDDDGNAATKPAGNSNGKQAGSKSPTKPTVKETLSAIYSADAVRLETIRAWVEKNADTSKTALMDAIEKRYSILDAEHDKAVKEQ